MIARFNPKPLRQGRRLGRPGAAQLNGSGSAGSAGVSRQDATTCHCHLKLDDLLVLRSPVGLP